MLAALCTPRVASGCPSHHTLPAHAVLAWGSFDPFALPPIALFAIGYIIGARRLRRHAMGDGGLRWWERASFALGIVTLVVALWSPLDRLSDIAFAAHMAQHELLMLVAPPLIVLGRPTAALWWALPRDARAEFAAMARTPRVRTGWRIVSDPVAALVVHGTIVWAWHWPSAFEAALHNELVHGVQHALFFATAALFFWSLRQGRYGKGGYGLAALYVFLTALHTGVLGALLSVATRTWYPTQAARASDWSLNALEDQQLAGLIMWIPGGVALALIGLAFLSAWIGESEQRARQRDRRASSHLGAAPTRPT